MKTAEQIQKALKTGATAPWEAQVELLLDIRHLLAVMVSNTAAVAENTKKAPRRKKAASG